MNGHGAYPLGFNNPFRYRGYYYDYETNLYYLQSRYYDPVNGRFLNADNQIAAESFNSVNLYAYCDNDPVNRVDPTGEAWWHWAVAAVAVVAVGVALVATAGGAAGAVLAVSAVVNGTVAAGTTAATTALATAFVAGTTTLLVSAGIAAVDAAQTMLDGGSFSDALDTFAAAGEQALIDTGVAMITAGVLAYADVKMANQNNKQQQCFIAGTQIKTEKGNVPIEAITAAMLVFAHDPETGETALKKVVRTFINETKELVHVFLMAKKS